MVSKVIMLCIYAVHIYQLQSCVLYIVYLDYLAVCGLLQGYVTIIQAKFRNVTNKRNLHVSMLLECNYKHFGSLLLLVNLNMSLCTVMHDMGIAQSFPVSCMYLS